VQLALYTYFYARACARACVRACVRACTRNDSDHGPTRIHTQQRDDGVSEIEKKPRGIDLSNGSRNAV